MIYYGDAAYFNDGLRAELRNGEPVYVGEGLIKFRLEYQDVVKDQGLTIQVLGAVDGAEVSVLRFYCFYQLPHYYYGPEERNDWLSIDRTTEGDPLEWSLYQIRHRLPSLVSRAGYEELAAQIDMGGLELMLTQMEETARTMEREQRRTVTHNRGDVMVEAGPVRFGVEDREPGIAIHVLGDVDGEEKELLALDCFDVDPHYHYGPRAKNERLYLDPIAIPDSLRWAIDLLKGDRLDAMLRRAGYPDHAARLDPATVAEKVAEVESVAFGMRAGRAK